MLAQKTRLVHYDATRPITLAADASSDGIGAVISQRAPDGTEEPIALLLFIINACVRVADVMTFTFVSLMPVHSVCRIM